MRAGDFLLVTWLFLLAPVASDREGQPMQSGEVPQKSIALHRAVKAMSKRNVEGSSASRPVRIKGGASDGPSRSLGAAMGLEMGRVDVRGCRPAAMGALRRRERLRTGELAAW